MKKIGWALAIGLVVLLGSACAEHQAQVAARPEDGDVRGSDNLTPGQQEGPYYPVEKPAVADNDLVTVKAGDPPAAGEVLSLSGIVYDADGARLEGLTVEIWQTDSQGIYQHPDDPEVAQRDRNFQFYGQSVTGADGVYSFRTVLPGRYGARPRHIHVKVRQGAELLLTTQFYFANELSLSGPEANLLIDMAQAEDDRGQPIWVGERDIVLRP
ncbi:MAG: hypothetical protein R3300_14050 [Candidatus Promineifilaceae bacterium]|nr:hypothetical protein [Candidatus Promineifilaceae bacterium]